MNDLLALLHDTSHDLNNIKIIAGWLKEEQLDSAQQEWIDKILKCEENLRYKLDQYYLANKK